MRVIPTAPHPPPRRAELFTVYSSNDANGFKDSYDSDDLNDSDISDHANGSDGSNALRQ